MEMLNSSVLLHVITGIISNMWYIKLVVMVVVHGKHC